MKTTSPLFLFLEYCNPEKENFVAYIGHMTLFDKKRLNMIILARNIFQKPYLPFLLPFVGWTQVRLRTRTFVFPK